MSKLNDMEFISNCILIGKDVGLTCGPDYSRPVPTNEDLNQDYYDGDELFELVGIREINEPRKEFIFVRKDRTITGVMIIPDNEFHKFDLVKR